MSSKQTKAKRSNVLRKLVVFVVSGVLMTTLWALYLAPTVASGEETITVKTIWFAGQHEWFQPLIEIFEKTHPNVKFEVTVMGVVQLEDITIQLMTDPEGPDTLMANYGTWTTVLPVLAEAGFIVNLDPYYEKYGWWEFLPEHLRTHQIRGSMYLFSVGSVFVPVVYYNKAIFREIGADVPTTWEEFYAVCGKLRSEGYEPIALGNRDAYPAYHIYQGIAARTVPMEDYEKVQRFTSAPYKMADYPGFAKAFGILREMEEKKYWATGSAEMAEVDAQQLFFGGKAGMVCSGTWSMNTFREALGDDLGFFIFPPIEKDIPASLTVSLSDEFPLMSSAKPEVRDAVAEFFDLVLSKQGQVVRMELGNMPIRTDFTSAELEKYDPIMLEVMRMFSSGEYPVTDELWTFWNIEAATEIQALGQEVIAGIKTPEQVVEALDKLATRARGF